MDKKNNRPVKIAIVGYGYWGPNLVRNFNERDDAEIAVCCDLREERLKIVKSKYPSIKTTNDFNGVLADKTIEAVIISTPLSSHYPLAKKALEANKHVWVEKPLADSAEKAKELTVLAVKKKKVLLVDHTFLYTEAVQKIKNLIENNELGDIYYFDSVRINLGLFQPDSNVIWDLAPHDISIMQYLMREAPESVTVFATAHVKQGMEDTAYLNFRYKNGSSAHIHVSWLSPVKIRRTIIAGSKKMVFYDDLEPSEKIRIYDRGVSLKNDNLPLSTTSGYQYRQGDIYLPALETKEALQMECQHFIECIRQGKKPLTGGKEGWQTVKIIEAAITSLRNNGRVTRIFD